MARRQRFSNAVIELFEALAPDTDEVLAEFEKMSDAELEQEIAPHKKEFEAIWKRIDKKLKKHR